MKLLKGPKNMIRAVVPGLSLCTALIVFAFCVLFPMGAFSHSGGLNSSGCHAGSKPYHCHRSASAMTTSTSGGNRLKCSAGSVSKDCENNGSSQTASSNTVETNTELDVAVIELASSKNVADTDGEAITIFGFNYDIDQDLAIARIAERFDCNPFRLQQQCLVENTIIQWSKDSLGKIITIDFYCEAFNGCTYSGAEIFQNLNDRFQLIGQVKEDKHTICDQGVAGEEICVSKYSKTITLSKLKFRQKPMSFD